MISASVVGLIVAQTMSGSASDELGDHRGLVGTRHDGALAVVDDLEAEGLGGDLGAGGAVLAVLTGERDDGDRRGVEVLGMHDTPFIDSMQ